MGSDWVASGNQGDNMNLQEMSPSGWTLVLLYPDYCAENYGHDTFIQHTAEARLDHAISAIQKSCWKGCPDVKDPEDLDCIAAFKGDQESYI